MAKFRPLNHITPVPDTGRPANCDTIGTTQKCLNNQSSRKAVFSRCGKIIFELKTLCFATVTLTGVTISGRPCVLLSLSSRTRAPNVHVVDLAQQNPLGTLAVALPSLAVAATKAVGRPRSPETALFPPSPRRHLILAFSQSVRVPRQATTIMQNSD